MAENTTGEQETGTDAETPYVVDNWEFVGRVPTSEEVRSLLETLPDVWGVVTADFAQYVQGLPQKKKIRKPHPDPERAERGLTIDEHVDAYTLYMGVAGRIKMLEAAALLNGWRVDFTPEPFLFDPKESGRLVYRETVTIWAPRPGEDGKWDRLGSKPGMAWVPWTGGSQAAGSNPFEKVETSARGRALAAWGFGILPGSGIASLEEMASIRQNGAALKAERGAEQMEQSRPARQRETKGELISSTLTVAEQLRQARGIDVEESHQKIGEYLSKSFGFDLDMVWRDGEIIWAPVKDAQILLLRNSLQGALANLRDQQSEV